MQNTGMSLRRKAVAAALAAASMLSVAWMTVGHHSDSSRTSGSASWNVVTRGPGNSPNSASWN
jgi:hypothetical protein